MMADAKRECFHACCLAAGGVVYAFFALRCGASLFFLPAAWIYLALAVWLPGHAAARLLNGEHAGPALSLALGLSSYSAVCVACSLCTSGVPALLWLAFSLVFALLVYRQVPRAPATPLPRLFAPAVAALLIVLALAAGRAAHPAAVGVTVPQQDLYWNAGNAASFALGFPPQDLRYSGYTLTYHYLSELWAYGLSAAWGGSCYDAVAFVLPPALLLAALWVCAELGAVLWPKSRRAMALPWLVLLLGCAGGIALLDGLSPFQNLFTIHLLTNINAMGAAVLLLAAFLVLMLAVSRNWRNARLWPACLLCFAMLCAAKGPVAGLAALAAVCAVVLMLPRLPRAERLRAVLFSCLVLAVFVCFYKLLFSAGTGASVSFSSHATLEKSVFAPVLAALKGRSGLLYTLSLPVFMALQSVCMAPFAFPLFCAGAVWVLAKPRTRLAEQNVVQLFCYALGFGGLLAFFLFDHPSMSQSYFAYAALFAIDINALDALGRFAPKSPRPVRLLGGMLAVLSIFTGCCSCSYLACEGAQALFAPGAAVAEKANYTPLTADEENALLWLGKAMPADELFATNRMHTGPAEEGLSNVYTAISGRRAYMESFKYAMTNLGIPAEDVGARYDTMSELFGFVRSITPERAAEICCETNITWLVYNKTLQGSDAAFVDGYFDKRFENDTVVIYELNMN